VSDIVKLNLFKSYVSYSYVIDSLVLNHRHIRDLNVCYNDMFRRTFGVFFAYKTGNLLNSYYFTVVNWFFKFV